MQLDFFDVPSPCIGVCQSDNRGYCLGCQRSRDERLNWNEYDNEQKQKVIKLCRRRQQRKQTKAEPSGNETVISPGYLFEQPSLLDPPQSKQVATDKDMDFGDFEL